MHYTYNSATPFKYLGAILVAVLALLTYTAGAAANPLDSDAMLVISETDQLDVTNTDSVTNSEEATPAGITPVANVTESLDPRTEPNTVEEPTAIVPLLGEFGELTGTVDDDASGASNATRETAEPQLVEPLVETVAQVEDEATTLVTGVTETVDTATAPVTNTVTTTTEPILEQVATETEPVLEDLTTLNEPVANQVTSLVEPVPETVSTVTEPVLDALEPVVEPVGNLADLISEPVLDVMSPVSEPLTDSLLDQPVGDDPVTDNPDAPAVGDPIVETPVVVVPELDTPASNEPASDRPSADIPFIDDPSETLPKIDDPAPVADESGVEQPIADASVLGSVNVDAPTTAPTLVAPVANVPAEPIAAERPAGVVTIPVRSATPPVPKAQYVPADQPSPLLQLVGEDLAAPVPSRDGAYGSTAPAGSGSSSISDDLPTSAGVLAMLALLTLAAWRERCRVALCIPSSAFQTIPHPPG